MQQEFERTEELLTASRKKKTKKKLLIIVIVAAIAAAAAGVFAGIRIHNDDQVKEQLKIAQASLREGDYSQAIVSFDKVIEMDDTNAAAYEGKGDAYARKGDYGESVRSYRKAIDKDKENKDIYRKADNSAVRGNDKKAAEEIISEMHDNIPGTKDTNIDNYLEARKAYQKILNTIMDNNRLVTSNSRIDDLLEAEWGDPEENEFAVTDVDGDGEEELLFNAKTTFSAHMGVYLIRYKGNGKTELIDSFTSPEYYADGSIKGIQKHLPDHSGDAYLYTKYDTKKKDWVKYEVKEYLESTFMPEDEQTFPSDKDKNNDGKVYVVSSEYDPETYQYKKDEYYDNGSEFDKWTDKMFISSKVNIRFSKFTTENIDALTSWGKKVKSRVKKPKPGQQTAEGKVEVTTYKKRAEDVEFPSDDFKNNNKTLVLLHLDREKEVTAYSVGDPGYYTSKVKTIALPGSFAKYSGKRMMIAFGKKDGTFPADTTATLYEVDYFDGKVDVLEVK